MDAGDGGSNLRSCPRCLAAGSGSVSMPVVLEAGSGFVSCLLLLDSPNIREMRSNLSYSVQYDRHPAERLWDG